MMYSIVHVVEIILILIGVDCKSETSDYAIDKIMIPVLYKLKIKPDFENKNFKVELDLVVRIWQNTNVYKLHQSNLYVHHENFKMLLMEYIPGVQKFKRSIKEELTGFSPSEDTCSFITPLVFKTANSAGEYLLRFSEVDGSLENKMRGLYYDELLDPSGKISNFLITQLSPFGTRYVFPSFDEPYFRARFALTIVRPKEYNCVITNSPLKKSVPVGDLVEDEFEETPYIAPHSLAFSVSKMMKSENTIGIHQIVGDPKVIVLNSHAFALQLVDSVYSKIEKLLNDKLDLTKFYHVAIPTNRMKFEGLGSYWGVNHYREDVLIISNKSSNYRMEESTVAISALIAKQWFVNSLVVESWTWAWLSEGLSFFVAYKMVDEIHPKWNIKEKVFSEIRSAMQYDSITILNSAAYKCYDVESKFNSLTTYKGLAMIYMMNQILPEGVFIRGVQNLVADRKNTRTMKPNDLYKHVEKVLVATNSHHTTRLPKTFSEIMSMWDSQLSYPIVEVMRTYHTGSLETAYLSQTSQGVGDLNVSKKRLWCIPINYAVEKVPNFNNTDPTYWLHSRDGKLEIRFLRENDWLIINNQAMYYYRVNYDQRNWLAITKALLYDHHKIHYLNRMQILDDAFRLAEYGLLNYEIAFNISKYLINERRYAPLKIMKELMSTISIRLVGTATYIKFQDLIKFSVEVIYNKLLKRTETTTVHRHHITLRLLYSWLCDLSSKICNITTARRRIMKISSEEYSEISKFELCYYVRLKDAAYGAQMFEKYKKKKFPDFFYALWCSTDRNFLEIYLKYTIQNDVSKISVGVQLLLSNGKDVGKQVALKMIPKEFDNLSKKLDEITLKDMLLNIGARVTTKKELKILTKLSEKYKKLKHVMSPAIAKARSNLEWRDKYLRTFEFYYLPDYKGSSRRYHCIWSLYLLLIINYLIPN